MVKGAMTRRTFLQRTNLAVNCAWAAQAKASHLRLSQLTSSTASLSGFSFEEALEKIAAMGFGGVEILTFTGKSHSVGPIPGVVVSELSRTEKNRLRERVGRFEHVTTHLPFIGLRPVDSNPVLRKSSQAAIRQGILDSSFWGARIATAHVAAENDYQSVRKDILDVYRRFGDLAARSKVRLAIETGAPNRVGEFLQLIRDIDHEWVGATVDTGHTRAYRADAGLADTELGTPRARHIYNDLLLKKVQGLGPKLYHFHADDVRAQDWREHRSLGSGIVDWPRLLRYCDEQKYQGMFATELEETDVVRELARSREFFARCLEVL
jgi:sugar phosphate isomerase/epimerase